MPATVPASFVALHESRKYAGTVTTASRTVTQKSLCRCFRCGQHHGADIFRGKLACFTLMLYLDFRLPTVVHHCKGPVLHVAVKVIVEASADQPFRIGDGILGINGHLFFGGVSGRTLGVIECHLAGSSAFFFIVCNDLRLTLLPDAHARIRDAQVNSNSRGFRCHISPHNNAFCCRYSSNKIFSLHICCSLVVVGSFFLLLVCNVTPRAESILCAHLQRTAVQCICVPVFDALKSANNESVLNKSNHTCFNAHFRGRILNVGNWIL